MKSRITVIFILIILTFTLQACGAKSEPLPSLDDPIKLIVTLRESMSFAPFIIAQEEGYFAEYRLEVEFIASPRSTEAVAALLQKEIDVYASTFSVGIFNAMSQGEPIKLVANKGYFDPEGCTFHAFSVRIDLFESGEITSAEHLVGRNVSFRLGTLPSYIMDTALRPFGYSSLDIEDVDIPSAVENEALQEKTVDAIAHAEPNIARVKQLGIAIPLIRGNEVLPGAAWGMVMFGPSILEDNPDAGKRFIAAYLKAVAQYNEGKTKRNLDILEIATELDRDLLIQSCWPPITLDGDLDVGSVIDFQTWAVDNDLLDTIATEEQFWDSSYLDYANDILP